MVSRRDEVLQAALDLLDEVGLDALTTRRLAERLGVRPGALYRHFASKSELLGAMVEHLVGDGWEAADPLDADRAERIRGFAVRYRSALLTRRDGARLVATHLVPGPVARRSWDYLLATMSVDGVDADDVALTVDTIIAYVNGFTIEEQSRDGFPPESDQRAWRDARFRAGLELIIAGVVGPQPAATHPETASPG